MCMCMYIYIYTWCLARFLEGSYTGPGFGFSV